MMGVARFINRRLAFTGPKVPVAELSFADGVSVIWSASNTGKSFTVKALDFTSGAKPKMLPDIKERQGYDKAWLDLTLPKSGQVTLTRALAGGSFGLYENWVEPGTDKKANRTLSPEHKAKESLSAFLLVEIGIVEKVIAKTQNGAKAGFSFRHLVPYPLHPGNGHDGGVEPDPNFRLQQRHAGQERPQIYNNASRRLRRDRDA